MFTNFLDNRIRLEMLMVKFQGRAGGANIATKEPDKLVRFIGRGRNNMVVKIFLLFFL